MAAFFHGWPHEIWAFPFHYFKALRHDYLNIVAPPKKKATTGPGGIDVETYDIP
jgi:hypothetical protein